MHVSSKFSLLLHSRRWRWVIADETCQTHRRLHTEGKVPVPQTESQYTRRHLRFQLLIRSPTDGLLHSLPFCRTAFPRWHPTYFILSKWQFKTRQNYGFHSIPLSFLRHELRNESCANRTRQMVEAPCQMENRIVSPMLGSAAG